ncbi:hypothetical protein A2Y85_03720 [candidate division WOR-3 bacterium RBG_13_43_14]|uniref:Teneurin-like YD-shell domain-containing protein n=1 Tax=candidate division WOR-3 bacterium RBG_13_43_14 TaxID=1802590 RepID=A0A1F4U9I4_UNCW3|nr:MAG: hypothetical protein A2Y85_03720 [candidate division WOR-3 bacterium RBG_13_43_14]
MGNRLRRISGTDTTNYTYNRQNNQLTGESGNSYAYDDNGNMTEIHPVAEQDYYYYWDFENCLTKIKKTGSGGNDSLRMTYCGLGKRIKKIHGTTDTTSYAYDGMYAVCEFGGHLDLKANYVYANGMLLAKYDASPADTHYYHHDGLGTTMGMTNENGGVEQSYFYDEFGNSLGSWGSVSNHYLYTGQEYDDEISGAELYNLRARYYAPEIGRFMSEDPVLRMEITIDRICIGSKHDKNIIYMRKIPQQLNHYHYCLDNPVNCKDIKGLLQDWYFACALVMGCIDTECKKLLEPDTCFTESEKRDEEKKCEEQARDWFLECVMYKTTPLPPIPYFECRAYEVLFQYE